MNYVNECFSTFLQGIFSIFCFVVPGFFLLSFFTKNRFLKWPPVIVLTSSFLLSSLIVAAYQIFSCSLFSVYVSSILAICFLIFVIACSFFHSLPLLIKYWRSLDKWERLTIKLIATIFLFCLFTMPLSPYPAQEPLGLGDPPAYYRVIVNFVEGKGLLQDYFSMDYISGKYGYFKSTPLLIFITSLFFKIFGINWHSLFIYNSLSGILVAYLLSSFILWKRESSIISKKAEFFLTLAVLALPVYLVSVGLGIVGLPGILIFLFLTVVSMKSGIIRKKSKYILIGCSLLFLLFVRPEARYIAIIFLAIYLPAKLFQSLKRNKRILFVAVLVLMGVLSWCNLPAISSLLHRHFGYASLFYNKYDKDTGSFEVPNGGITIIPLKITFENIVGRKDFDKFSNSSIGNEIQKHPRAFLDFVSINYFHTANVLAYTFGPANSFWYPLLNSKMSLFLLMSFIVIYTFIKKRYRIVGLTIFSYLFTISLLNSWVTMRHVLIVSLPLAGLFIKTVLNSLSQSKKNKYFVLFEKKIIISPIILILAAAIIFNCYTTVSFRLNKRNRAHAPIIKAVQEYTMENDIVLSNFPTLLTCMTGRFCIGVMSITRFLPLIVKYIRPDIIIIDNARRDGPQDYTLFEKYVKNVKDYKIIYHNSEEEFVLLGKK